MTPFKKRDFSYEELKAFFKKLKEVGENKFVIRSCPVANHLPKSGTVPHVFCCFKTTALRDYGFANGPEELDLTNGLQF